MPSVSTGGAPGPRILTPDQRPRVFISSTLQELAPERAAARAAVERLRLIPVMFELGARPHPAARSVPRLPGAEPRVRGAVLRAVRMGRTRRGDLRPRGRVPALRRAAAAGLPQGAGARPRAATEGAARHRPRRRHRVVQVVRLTPRSSSALLGEDLAVLLAERFLLGGPESPARPRAQDRAVALPRGDRSPLQWTRWSDATRSSPRSKRLLASEQPARHRRRTRWDREDAAGPRGGAPGGSRLRRGPDRLRPARGGRRPGGRPAGRRVLDRAGPGRRRAGAGRPGRCVRRPALRPGPRQLRAGAPGGDRRGRAPHPLPRR